MTLEHDAEPPEPNNGHGGARANSGGARPNCGGARPGSGRPRKIRPPEVKKAYAHLATTIRNTPRGPKIIDPRILVDRPIRDNDGTIVGTELKHAPPGLTTSGALSQYQHAWVYVGVRKKDGIVKVGMSGDPARRCRGLGISLFFAHPVMPGMAKTLETMALRRLGALKSGTEWVFCKPEDAADAIVAARTELSRSCHADPNETPAEAYSRRTGAAAA